MDLLGNTNQPGVDGPYRFYQGVPDIGSKNYVFDEHNRPRALWVRGTAASAKLTISQDDAGNNAANTADLTHRTDFNLKDSAEGAFYPLSPRAISKDCANVEVVACW